MPFNPLKTFQPGEGMTAAIFNAQLRDNLNVVRNAEDSSGRVVLGFKMFAYGGGGAVPGMNANAAGGGDTKLTGYTVSLPADLFQTWGDSLVIEGTLVLAANTNSKTAKLRVGSATAMTFLVNAQNVANHIVPFRLLLKYEASGTVALQGLAFPGATGGGQCSGGYIAYATASGLAFSQANDLDVYLASSAASDIFLSDYSVWSGLSSLGSQV